MARTRRSKVFLANRAIEDLEAIESYTVGKWGVAQAAKYLETFDRFFRLVEAELGILQPIPVIEKLLVHTVESHIVVCTKWNDDILFLTIVHASRDLVPHLNQLLPGINTEVEAMKKRLL